MTTMKMKLTISESGKVEEEMVLADDSRLETFLKEGLFDNSFAKRMWQSLENEIFYVNDYLSLNEEDDEDDEDLREIAKKQQKYLDSLESIDHAYESSVNLGKKVEVVLVS